jgi:hypothetical protein
VLKRCADLHYQLLDSRLAVVVFSFFVEKSEHAAEWLAGSGSFTLSGLSTRMSLNVRVQNCLKLELKARVARRAEAPTSEMSPTTSDVSPSRPSPLKMCLCLK